MFLLKTNDFYTKSFIQKFITSKMPLRAYYENINLFLKPEYWQSQNKKILFAKLRIQKQFS